MTQQQQQTNRHILNSELGFKASLNNNSRP